MGYAASEYFPSDINLNGLEEYYSDRLSAFREPSLSTLNETNRETYRFLWLRAFHNAVVIRAERRGETYRLIVKKLSSTQGGSKPAIVLDRERVMTRNQWKELTVALTHANYWGLPTTEQRHGKDGAYWVLEGMKSGRYHVVDRWSPEGGAFQKACHYLLKLSGLKVNPIY
jgi:hypothetical protein